MKWSPQQDQARRTVARWMSDPAAPQVLYMAGYAGTGKSTLAKDLVSGSDRQWLFAAYTGKAAHVLRQKGCDGASTIHSRIYRPAGEAGAQLIAAMEKEIADPDTTAERRSKLIQQIIELRNDGGPRFTLWETGPLSEPEIAGIVVDEVSMVDERIGRDLESFGKKILVLGDPAQLPPVRGTGYFTNREPDVMLTEVHRHARESGVLRLATHIRQGGTIAEFTDTGDGAEILSPSSDLDDRSRIAMTSDQILVGLNKTRGDANRRMRDLRNRTGRMPYKDDRLVCLRNEKESGLFNGSQWIVVDAKCDDAKLTGQIGVRSEDDGRIVATKSWLHHFVGRGDEVKAMGPKARRRSEFDWGYALTVHKAQGSQWSRVLVVDESDRFRSDSSRWLYTAITRAANHVAVLASS